MNSGERTQIMRLTLEVECECRDDIDRQTGAAVIQRSRGRSRSRVCALNDTTSAAAVVGVPRRPCAHVAPASRPTSSPGVSRGGRSTVLVGGSAVDRIQSSRPDSISPTWFLSTVHHRPSLTQSRHTETTSLFMVTSTLTSNNSAPAPDFSRATHPALQLLPLQLWLHRGAQLGTPHLSTKRRGGVPSYWWRSATVLPQLSRTPSKLAPVLSPIP